MGNRAAQFRAEYAGLPVKRRGRQYIEFDNGDGSTTWVGTIEPLHYGATQDQEIADTWESDTGAWQWRMVSNRFNLHARSTLNAGDVLQWLDADTGQYVNVQPLGLNWVDSVTNSRQQIALPQAVTATASDNTLTWTNGYGAGRHFRYTSHPKRLLKELIIDSAANLPTPTVSNPWLEVEFAVTKSTGCTYWVDGAAWDNSTLTTTANRIEVRANATGEVLWYFDAPTARDANGATTGGVLQLRRQGQNRYCTVRVPKSWVDSAVFPIALDPTFTSPQTSAVKDTHVKQDQATTNYGTGTFDIRGLSASFARNGLIQYDLSTLAGMTITSAIQSFYITWQSGSEDTSVIELHQILTANSAWTEAEATWNTLDGTNNWAGGNTGCGTSGTDYSATTDGSVTHSGNNPAVGTEYQITVDTTRMAALVAANYGWVVLNKPSSGDHMVGYASSDDSTAGYRPKLVVVYESPRTVQNITAALKWIRTRTVQSITAALGWSRSRTVQSVTASLALAGATTRTVQSITAALQRAGFTRSVQTVTASLQRAGYTRTVQTVTVALRWSRTRTVESVTAALKIARSRAVQSVTAAVLGTSRRTVQLVTASLTLTGTATRTVQNVTAALRQGFSRSVGSISAVLASRIGRPEATISSGNWTTAPLWSKVDEP